MRFLKGAVSILHNVLVNGDRMVASLFGAPEDETISSEIGRHEDTNPVAHVAAEVLDETLPGGTHGKHIPDAVAFSNAEEKGIQEFYDK